ncbi:GntR family transcriptional regulator [Roseovarius sp. S4756]|uniref:GntR family transcriptional regulator n=1 Tax=Roseovarius maritimus TaxID=3342637 RepID=UPI00372A6798
MKELSKESLGSAIYDRVSQDLVRGKLRPNQKVTIRGLAETLGTSSTPVRDAVQRLLQDNALEQRSLRDVRVPVPTMAQYQEIAALRAELEGMAAAEAARVATPQDITSLRRIIARNEEAIAAARWTRAAELNQQFHFALAEVARMPMLLDILTRLWLRMGPLISGYYDGAKQDMVQRHHGVIAAFEAGDSDAARAEIRADIAEGREGITRYIASFGEEFGPGSEPSR